MSKVFVSMPMRGRKIEEIRSQMAKAKKEVEEILGEPVELIDSVFDYEEGISNPVSMLALSIQALANADYIYGAEEWKDSRGCLVEHIIAELYGIKTIQKKENHHV